MQQRNIKKALNNLDNAGYRLRCAREYMGLSEKEVAEVLKLMVSHIRAIEQNRSEYIVQRKPFERYLRAYAQLVQLNPDTIVNMYFARSTPASPAQLAPVTAGFETPADIHQPTLVMPQPTAITAPVAQNILHNPLVLAGGFLLIGLSLVAGWGVKQFVSEQGLGSFQPLTGTLEVAASRKLAQSTADADTPVTTTGVEAELSPEVAIAEAQPGTRAAVASQGGKVEANRGFANEEAMSEATGATGVETGDVNAPNDQNIANDVRTPTVVITAAKTETRPPAEVLAMLKAPAVAEKAVPMVKQRPPAAKSTVNNSTASAKKPAALAEKQRSSPVATADNRSDSDTDSSSKVRDDGAAESKIALVTQNAPSRPTTVKPAKVAPAQPAAKKASPVIASIALVDKPAERMERPAINDAKPAREKKVATVSGAPNESTNVAVAGGQKKSVPDQSSRSRGQNLAIASNTNSTPADQAGAGLDEAIDLAALIEAEQQRQAEKAAIDRANEAAAADRLALLESYKTLLRKRVYENVEYPRRALSRNQEGKVVVSATVDRSGELIAVQVDEQSKYRSLNRASEKALEKSSPFPPAPTKLTGESFKLTVPVVFKVPR